MRQVEGEAGFSGRWGRVQWRAGHGHKARCSRHLPFSVAAACLPLPAACLPAGRRRCCWPPACLAACPHLSEMDISSSTVTGRLTWPEMANSLVPWLFLRPNPANHSGPRRRMVGLTATVSTLVTGEGVEGRQDGRGDVVGARECTWAGAAATPLVRRAAWSPEQHKCGRRGRLLRLVPAAAWRGRTGGGAAVEAHVGWEGRLQPRLALLALQRLDQRSLLACRAGRGRGAKHAFRMRVRMAPQMRLSKRHTQPVRLPMYAYALVSQSTGCSERRPARKHAQPGCALRSASD